MDASIYGPASLAAGQTLGGFMAFLPRLSEVRKANASVEHDIVGDVRLGEVASCAIALGMGAIASSLSKSPFPMYAAVLVAVIMVAVYEVALRGDNPMNPKRRVERSA